MTAAQCVPHLGSWRAKLLLDFKKARAGAVLFQESTNNKHKGPIRVDGRVKYRLGGLQSSGWMSVIVATRPNGPMGICTGGIEALMNFHTLIGRRSEQNFTVVPLVARPLGL